MYDTKHAKRKCGVPSTCPNQLEDELHHLGLEYGLPVEVNYIYIKLRRLFDGDV